jgi:uncharacterized cupredoxin-like copper-binding protein
MAAALAAAAALALPAAAQGAAPVKVSEKEFAITGIPKTLKHGVRYTIALRDTGTLAHDLLFDGKGVDDVGIHNRKPVAPGGSAHFTITFPKAGTYEFYCAIKGHAAKGMKGKVKVT